MKDLFAYKYMDTPIHNMSGLSKIICFLLISFAVMFSFDIRFIIFVLLFSVVVFKMARLRFKQVRLMIFYVFVFVIVNSILTYIFEPEYGVKIYGTRHELFKIFGRYTMTSETMLYLVSKMLKYSAVIPFGIIFFLTTDPSEFASALNGVGVPYKVAYAVGLTLRYFPDIQRNYREISQAQQARGLELSSKGKAMSRLKNSLLIILPLILSSIDRVESIGNAMDLRGFGKAKKRTWYSKKDLYRTDYIAIFISALILIMALVLIYINGGRFYNIFKG